MEQEAIAECFTDVLTTFCGLLWSATEQMHDNMDSICFIQQRNKLPQIKLFYAKILHRNSKAGLCLLRRTRKEPFDVIYNRYKIYRAISLVTTGSKELWLVQENRATVKPNLVKWNLQILKKMLENSSQFLSSEQLCEPKCLDVALNIVGVEKISSENLWLRSTWRPFDSSFEWKDR